MKRPVVRPPAFLQDRNLPPEKIGPAHFDPVMALYAVFFGPGVSTGFFITTLSRHEKLLGNMVKEGPKRDYRHYIIV